MSKLHLRLLVFVSGATVMAVEMTGLRLLAPFFGTSLVVTTLLIGSMMGFLSLGYWLGGRRGDRHPSLRALCFATTLAALFVLVLPFIGQPVLRASASVLGLVIDGEAGGGAAAATIAGGLLGTLALFAVPVTLMGMVSPWAVRLDLDRVESAGGTAGRLYALSTVGSILGSFLPALLLIPLLGVRNTFVVAGFALLAVSAVGLLGRTRGPAAACLVLPALLLPQGTVRPADGLLMETESLYHYIQVTTDSYGKCEQARHLVLNEGVAVHSVKCLEPGVETRGVWGYVAAGPLYLDDPSSLREVLIIGLAGGTVARHILESHPQAHIDGVEIDGAVVEVGRQYFDNDDPRITPYVMDGRSFVQNTERSYDVIVMDAYRQPYIPFHLTTVEFWREVRERLNEQGVVVVNVASVRGSSDRLLRMMYRTLREVFPTVHHVTAMRSNDLLFATVHPTPATIAVDNLARMPSALGLDRIRRGYRKKIAGEPRGWEDALLLTDDKAPVELAWDLMALDYARK